MTVRVFLIDDHALVRTGIKMILGGQADIEVVGEAESGELALPQIRQLKPDVVLCDLHLPGLSGLEITERIIKGKHGTRVIIVSVLEDGPMPQRLMEAGASGYVARAVMRRSWSRRSAMLRWAVATWPTASRRIWRWRKSDRARRSMSCRDGRWKLPCC